LERKNEIDRIKNEALSTYNKDRKIEVNIYALTQAYKCVICKRDDLIHREITKLKGKIVCDSCANSMRQLAGSH